MPDKYSFAKCEQYGRRLAARLCQQRFAAEPGATLDGPALLQLTPLRQVNLLVLQQLLDYWQRETQALRSPYFDFEAEAVRAALTQFMNVLSRHIAVGRAALEPLLAGAIAHTLLLATDPAAAFARLLLPPATADAATAEVPVAYLRERLRYFDGSKAFFTGFVDSLPGGNAPLSGEFLRQRFELYQASRYKELPALPPLVAELSTLLPLTEADLREDGPSPARPVPAPVAAPRPAVPAAAATPLDLTLKLSAATSAAPAPAPAAPAPAPLVSADASAAPAPTPAVPAVPLDAPTPPAPAAASPAPAPVVSADASASPAPATTVPADATTVLANAPAVPAPALPPPPVARPVVPSFAPVTEPAPATPLHEKLKASQPTGSPLAEALRGAAHAGTTLAERGAPQVGSLRAAISINQRYGFINELFNGENGEYQAAIEHLDQLPTAAAALGYVQAELAPRYDWARKDEHVGKLLKLIERKFAEA